jgi:adenylylsulfate kinase
MNMPQQTTANIHWHTSTVTKADRQQLNGHKSCVLWFTGLSGSGKSTLANAVDKKLHEMGIKSYVLDGDNIRYGLNMGLGFSPQDRAENIRRIAEVSKLFVDAGVIVLTAFISPYRADRDMARKLLAPGEFIEVYADCPLEICEERDPKGLYKKARRGEIPEFTGISAPYEMPSAPEITVDSDRMSIDEEVDEVIRFLINRQILS